jgi:3-oxoacyl-[acyl-carrier protein] reductase
MECYKVIIVTGASRGLGAAVVRSLLAKGEVVFGIARDASELPCEGASCDVSCLSDLKLIARKIRRGGGSVTGVVNCAGVAAMNLALTTPEETVRKLISINLMGTIFTCQAFGPLMVRSKAGSIINFSTIAVDLGLRGESVYVASKAGVEGFSYALANEFSDFNIRVNCIAPGPIDTSLLSGVSSEQINNIVRRQVLKKQFKPSDICDVVEFLLSDASSSISGQVLKIGGS